jgi:hypothetical protein
MSQIHALIEHVKDPYKPAVWLLVLTGIRPAELADSEWAQWTLPGI